LQSLIGVLIANAANSGDAALGELSDVCVGAFLVLALVGEEQDFGSSDDSGFAGAGSGELFEVLTVFGWQVDFGAPFHASNLSDPAGLGTKYILVLDVRPNILDHKNTVLDDFNFSSNHLTIYVLTGRYLGAVL
jgi:hypothetical protein